MIKLRNKDQIEFPGMKIENLNYSDRKIKLLEKSWAGIFRNYVLDSLPVSSITKFYSSNTGRSSKELYAVMGAVVLQQFFDYTDSETVEHMAFNEQWHYALKCYDDDDQIICKKTLWSMRKNFIELGLVSKVFSEITDDFVKQFNVDTSKTRIDSVHIHSNMARFGRIRILSRTIIKFLKSLKRKDLSLFTSKISISLIEKYLDKSADSYFGQTRPSDSERTLQDLGNDMHSLILNFELNQDIAKMKEFRLLQQVFSEHCLVEDKQVKVRDSREVLSSSVQNPSDPDAGFDKHKGQGFQTQITETYNEKEESKEDDENDSDNGSGKETLPSLDLIVHVSTESADNHDSKALMPAIDDLLARGHNVEQVLADTLYGSNGNIQKAKDVGVTVITPVAGIPSKRGFEKFVFDIDTLEITTCQNGKSPDKIKYNNKKSITAIWYKETCVTCPFADNCPTKKTPKGRSINYTRNSIISFFRRQFEESFEFKDKYRYRSGIEATISRFIHMTSARRSRYRGTEKLEFGQTLKALAINVFRITKYLEKVARIANILKFTFNFHIMNEFSAKFAA